MNVSYGINVADEDDQFVRAAENAVQAASEGLVPGKFLVEFFPFLRHIPAWLPGASSQRLFAKWQAAGEELKNVPFEYVKRSMVSTTYEYAAAASRPGAHLKPDTGPSGYATICRWSTFQRCSQLNASEQYR